MAGLIILTEIGLGSCAFLLYFLYALWRESRKLRRRPQVEIRRLPDHKREEASVIPIREMEQVRRRKRL